MRNRIWRLTALSVLVATVLFGALSLAALYRFFTQQTNEALDRELRVTGAAVSLGGDLQTLARANPQTRLTLVAADGTVLFDSQADAAQMENHLARPEIAQALETGRGSSARASQTLEEMTIYRACLLEDGTVLRVSGTQKSVLGLLWSLVPVFALLLVGTVVLSAAVSRRTTRRIVAPVNDLDLEHPLDNDVYEELTPLLERMDEQNARIADYVQALTASKNEFAAVTDNMAEALLLLNGRGEVLFVNRAAQALLGTVRADCEGKYLLAVSRNYQLAAAMESALRGERGAHELQIDARHYQCVASPVLEGGEVRGAVLLILDVTDRYLAEKARREFTANVSHELKTPLTSILGYAEIMKNGLAGADKLREFSALIYREATRLIRLVEDILKLSRLDENRLGEDRGAVCLRTACQEAAARLEAEAGKRGVRIAVEGDECLVDGSPSMLGEMAFNLIENAIKYNREGGSVRCLTERRSDGTCALEVADTGVGIAPEDQPRVFERFFRADRSRSAAGGTGLGLSIVKHVAQAHGATVSLSSAPGEGTRVRVEFPGEGGAPAGT